VTADAVPGRRRLLVIVALTLSTVVWGSTFFLSKQVIARHDPMTVIAVRFAIGAALMLALRPRCLVGLDRRFWVRGLTLGAVYGVAQVPHYFGLRELPAAATAGFLIGIYVVFVPVIDFLVFRRRATARTVAGVTLAGVGLAVFAFSVAGSTLGFVLCLLAAVVYALQISVMGAWSPGGDTWAFTLLQLATVSVVTGVAAAVRGFDVPTSRADWLVVGYLAVVASVIAIGVQTWAQRRIPTAHAAVIMAGEPLWAATLAVAFTAETVSTRLVLGGVLLLVANVVIASARAAPEEHRGELGEPDDDSGGAQGGGKPTVRTPGRRAAAPPPPGADPEQPQDEGRGGHRRDE
jgi:drug/metabolite transporter (DMT)-like permease